MVDFYANLGEIASVNPVKETFAFQKKSWDDGELIDMIGNDKIEDYSDVFCSQNPITMEAPKLTNEQMVYLQSNSGNVKDNKNTTSSITDSTVREHGTEIITNNKGNEIITTEKIIENNSVTFKFSDGHEERFNNLSQDEISIIQSYELNSVEFQEFLEELRKSKKLDLQSATANRKLSNNSKEFNNKLTEASSEVRMGTEKLDYVQDAIKKAHDPNAKFNSDFKLDKTIKEGIQLASQKRLTDLITKEMKIDEQSPEGKTLKILLYKYLISDVKDCLKNEKDATKKEVLNEELKALEKSYDESGLKKQSYFERVVLGQVIPMLIETGAKSNDTKLVKYVAIVSNAANKSLETGGTEISISDIEAQMEQETETY